MLKIFLSALSLSLVALGCATSTMGPGAGAAQGIVKGTVEQVNIRAQDVLKQMNVQVVGNAVKDSGNEREITGRMGETEVTVTIENSGNNTSEVEVQAGKSLVEGNQDLAKRILSQIVERS